MSKNLISMDKKYRTRDGQEVRVLCTDRKHGVYPVVLALVSDEWGETIKSFTKYGEYTAGKSESPIDLIEVTPYDHINIDDPVYVRDYPSRVWDKRHFAGVDEKGQPLVWESGLTSFTTERTWAWDECLTVEEYEQKFGECHE